jgi:hypothetical protein
MFLLPGYTRLKKPEIKKRPGEKCPKPVRGALWRKYFENLLAGPHPKCGAGMVRAYVRDGVNAGTFKPVGWFCPECAGFVVECPHS